MTLEQRFMLLKSVVGFQLEQEMCPEFREAIVQSCFPDLRKGSVVPDGYRLIMWDGTLVGFLMVIDKYVNGIYVMPEYRRKGLARKAVMQFIADGGEIETLRIVRGDRTAHAFWKSLFNLKKIDSCPTDILYRVVGSS